MPANSTIFDSLPPMVRGKVGGELSIQARSLNLLSGSGSGMKNQAVSHSLRFQWWGHKGVIATISIPWKTGKTGAEGDKALFPLRAEKDSVRGYVDQI